MRTYNFVIDNAVTPTTANFKELTQMLWITNGNGLGAAAQIPVNRFLDIKPGSYSKTLKRATQQNQVDTLTPVGTTNGVTYSIQLVQLIPNSTVGGVQPLSGDYYRATYTIKTPASGSVTPTTIVTQLKGMINADPKIHVAATGTTTLVLTAEAGYPTFQTMILQTGLGLTVAHTTAGIAAFGVSPYLDLLKAGLVLGTDFIGSTLGYTRYSWITTMPIGDTNTQTTSQGAQVNVWVNNDEAAGTQSADLITAIDAIFAAATYQVGAIALA